MPRRHARVRDAVPQLERAARSAPLGRREGERSRRGHRRLGSTPRPRGRRRGPRPSDGPARPSGRPLTAPLAAVWPRAPPRRRGAATVARRGAIRRRPPPGRARGGRRTRRPRRRRRDSEECASTAARRPAFSSSGPSGRPVPRSSSSTWRPATDATPEDVLGARPGRPRLAPSASPGPSAAARRRRAAAAGHQELLDEEGVAVGPALDPVDGRAGLGSLPMIAASRGVPSRRGRTAQVDPLEPSRSGRPRPATAAADGDDRARRSGRSGTA